MTMADQTSRRPRRLRPFSAPIWRNRDFVLLWSGQAFSQFGANVSTVVVPLLAIGTLHAGSSALGAIGLLSKLPTLLYVVAGVWVDRVRKWPTLVSTMLVRCVLLLLIPVEIAVGVQSVGLLGATLFLSGVLVVWFDTAYMSYLPGLVGRDHLIEGNSRMESARASAQFTGPSVGGLLVQVVTAPIAVIMDGLSLLCSAITLSRIRYREAPVERASGPRGLRGVRDELAEGMRFLFGHTLLRPLALAIAVNNMAWAAETTLYVIFLVDVLHLPAALVGLTLIGSGPGAVVGSLAAGAVARRIGLAGAICSGLGLFCVAGLVIPLTPASAAAAVPLLIVASFLMSAGGQVCAINVLSMRQGVTPDRLQGRVNGSFRFLSLGLAPVGALLGGLLGAAIGPRAALFVTIGAMAIAPLLVWFSPVRHNPLTERAEEAG
jgi:predicted MFS family arabinose efflux permease